MTYGRVAQIRVYSCFTWCFVAWQGSSCLAPFFCLIVSLDQSLAAPHGCSSFCSVRSLWSLRTTTWYFAVLEISEGWMLMMMGLLVGDLVGVVRHDQMLLSGTANSCCSCLGLRYFPLILDSPLFWQGKLWHSCVICCIDLVLSQLRMVLFPGSQLAFLFYRYLSRGFP